MTQPDREQKAGDVLLEEGLVSREDIDQALTIQKKNTSALTDNRERLFGMVLCDLSLITPMDNYCALDKHGKFMSVEQYLVRKKILSRSRLGELAARARQEDTPLLSFLVDQGVVEKPQLQRILFDLFHIPLRSVSDIIFEKGSQKILASVIRREAAERHRCIPLQLNGSSLLVGITDPANLLYIQGLDQSFPQYRFTPVFIPFSGFTWFYRLLYGRNWEQRALADSVADRVAGKAPDRPIDRPADRPTDRPGSGPSAESPVVIADPVAEKEKIFALFDRYETLRGKRPGQGHPASGRRELFLAFIRQNHSRIADRYHCRRVRFSLKQDRLRPLVMASPEPEGGR